MESLTFAGDAFSEYYIRNLLWDEPRLRPLLGLDQVAATYRQAAAKVLRAQRELRARQQARSTQTLMLSPLAGVLGWEFGEEQTIQTAEGLENAGLPLTIEGRTVARILPIEPDAPLDLPPTGIHRRFAPTLSMVRVLEEMDLTWGVVVNAYELRLIRRAEGFVSSHIAFDLTSIAEGTQAGLDAWNLLWAVLRAEALATEPMILDRVVTNGRDHQAGVSEALGGQVRQAIVAFVQGVVSNPANAGALPRPLPQEQLNRLYAEALRVLYRALFALYAEARNLLPLDLPTYRDSYSITRLARQATHSDTDPRRCPTPSGRFYEHSLRALMELLRSGADLGPEGRIPKYNGAMFAHSRTELIESLVWGDATVAHILECLTLVPTRAGQVRLSYRELDVEQFGAVYEGLLEQVPQVAAESMYRVQLDGRQLVITANERQSLAGRRGEVVADGVGDADQDDDVDEDNADSDGGDGDADGDEDVQPRARTSKPLKVLAEIAPGTVYLKAGMGRKQTGSFYTSRPLVEFLVRRAIDPLAEEKPPEEILALKVLDPAMGSGHFLVGATRRLAEHLLAAYRKTYEQVLADQPALSPTDLFLEAGVHPEVARNWDHEDRALTACRLLVAGNCIYGVDKNPLAVDLARVSLWLATAATDHPLTFLDHRLRCGDSLLGLPLFLGGDDEPDVHLLKPDQPARPRGRRSHQNEAPLLAGVDMNEMITDSTRSLRDRISRAMGHLQAISELMDERPGDFAGHRTAFEAMGGELQWFTRLHALRIGREFLAGETAREMTLVNEWLVDIARDGRPSDEARSLAEAMIARGEQVGAFCWELAFPEVFFAPDGTRREDAGFDAVVGNPPWDKIKPNERELFSDFDPTVWDVQGQARTRLINALMHDNPAAKDAWEAHESETKITSKLLLEGGLYHHQIAVVEGKKTGGDPDTFKFFTERAWQLLRDDGRAGIILPLGIQGSLGTTALRRLLLDHCQLQALIKLDNERFIFPGVFHGQKFDLLVFAKGGHSERFDAAFFSWEPASVLRDLPRDPRKLTVDAELYRELSPEQYTFIELHDQRDVDLLRRIYRTFPRLGERLDDTWSVSFDSEFHMSGKSFLFRDAARLRQFDAVLYSPFPPMTEAAIGAPHEHAEIGEYWATQEDDHYAGCPDRFAPAERWVDSKGQVHSVGGIDEARIAYRLTGYVLAGETDDPSALPVKPDEKYVPLYEGRMVHQFDHCQKAYIRGSGRRAKWEELAWGQKRIVSHFLMATSDIGILASATNRVRAGICLVTGQTNERTTLVGMIPATMGCGHAFATASLQGGSVQESQLLVAVLNNFVVDWILRLQVSNNIGMYHLNGLPFAGRQPDDDCVGEIDKIVSQTSRLLATSPELAELWRGEGEWSREVACFDVCERAQLRAEVDARVATMYGLSAHEYARILSTFPLLDQNQPRLPDDCFIRQTNKGEKVEPRGFITRDLAMLTFFELTGKEPPTDIVAMFAEAGVDIEHNTGPIRDLRMRVEEASKRGAVAYIPTQYRGWKAATTSYLPPDLPAELAEDWEAYVGEHIVTDPQVNGGVPTLAGTRIKAEMVYGLLMQGWTFAQVLESYPHLTVAQIATALRWGDLGA